MRPTILLALLGLGACATPAPLHTFAVFFQDQATELDPAGAAVVSQAAVVAKQHPGKVVHVAGFADSDAPVEAIRLSQKRAQAVALQLQTDGVPAELIERWAVGQPPNSQPGVERRRVEIDVDQ